MKCVGCGFEMPADWPETEVSGQEGRTAKIIVCVPCSRHISVIKSAEGYKRIGAMTR